MFYIAYGSNFNTAQMCMRAKSGLAQPLGVGYLKGYKFAFKGNDILGYFATLVQDPMYSYKVPVLVYKIDEITEKALDKAEGIDDGYYSKELLEVHIRTFTGETTKRHGIIYLMNDYHNAQKMSDGIPDQKYVARMLTGYHQAGVNEKHIDCIRDALYQAMTEEEVDRYMEDVHKLINADNIALLYDRQALFGSKSQ